MMQRPNQYSTQAVADKMGGGRRNTGEIFLKCRGVLAEIPAYRPPGEYMHVIIATAQAARLQPQAPGGEPQTGNEDNRFARRRQGIRAKPQTRLLE